MAAKNRKRFPRTVHLTAGAQSAGPDKDPPSSDGDLKQPPPLASVGRITTRPTGQNDGRRRFSSRVKPENTAGDEGHPRGHDSRLVQIHLNREQPGRDGPFGGGEGATDVSAGEPGLSRIPWQGGQAIQGLQPEQIRQERDAGKLHRPEEGERPNGCPCEAQGAYREATQRSEDKDTPNSGLTLAFPAERLEEVKKALPGMGEKGGVVELQHLLAYLRGHMNGTSFYSRGNPVMTAPDHGDEGARPGAENHREDQEASRQGGNGRRHRRQLPWRSFSKKEEAHGHERTRGSRS